MGIELNTEIEATTEQNFSQNENYSGICHGRKITKTFACTVITGITAGALTLIALTTYGIKASHSEDGIYYGEAVDAEDVIYFTTLSSLPGICVGGLTSGVTYGIIKCWQNRDLVKEGLKKCWSKGTNYCLDLFFPKTEDAKIASEIVIKNV